MRLPTPLHSAEATQWLRRSFPTLLTLTLASSTPPPPQIHDGDTLRLHGTAIRLWGIDAPELAQTCGGVPAGEIARDALAVLVLRGVRCERAGPDSYGRTVARCSAGGADVGAAMVAAGWAWDYPAYSGGAYADAERQAREAGRGVWGVGCERAESWRDGH